MEHRVETMAESLCCKRVEFVETSDPNSGRYVGLITNCVESLEAEDDLCFFHCIEKKIRREKTIDEDGVGDRFEKEFFID